MSQVMCPRNQHLYDPSQGHCPACASEDLELSKTRAFYEPTPTRQAPVDDAGGQTTGYYGDLEVTPVVGWVACIAGPDKGRDWRLVAGSNFIGRSPSMTVVLVGDTKVSRERHAIIRFEPVHQVFSLLPGAAHGLVYLNDNDVMVPMPLAAHDRIVLGASTLMFVPLAGERFRWDS